MKQEDSLRIDKAILHILDSNVQIPIISSKELELEQDILKFLEGHILKVLSNGSVKTGVFHKVDNLIYNLCKKLTSEMENFTIISAELANNLFSIMIKNPDIPPGDVIICIFEQENNKYVALMKFNYKSSYIHYVMNTDEGNVNTIIKQTTTLPNDAQKSDECIIISLSDYEIKLLEKEYEINGSKDFYLSKLFLKCDCDFSNDDKFKIINKVTQKLNKKYFDEDFKKTAKLHKAIADSMEESDEIKIDSIASEVFEGNHEIKNEYIDEIRKEGLKGDVVNIQESNLVTKKLRTHRLKTDIGIEINLPSDHYHNKEIVEFINNPDGTISILLKNITKIINK
ncbi:hypothetical protein SAMN05446037_101422 [Anaerovirgula multivorans]|uniref:Nucleoid associated protein NdpA n=1 Tax=Anaerovirgula multivorans TaxID=312168 RepID=A0A239FTE6_9FIRM|nr:nucleoid-associated protein [Anaerovirgula multivorans]SNS59818.1 hypothetical protein SAMN05446037_101422 [Anaerovirgula multivorans]